MHLSVCWNLTSFNKKAKLYTNPSKNDVKFGFACWSVTIHSIIALFLYKFILTPVVYYVKFFSCIRTCFVIFDGLLCLFLLISYNTCYFQKTINYITKINNSKIFINKKHRGRCKHSVHLPHLIPD